MLNFSASPKKIIEIDFGSREKWPWSGGFGQTFDFMVHFLCECLHENYFPIIDDSTWWYGRWCDFFEPFWDEDQKNKLIQDTSIPRERKDINVPTLEERFELRNRGYVREMYDQIARTIFKFNADMSDEVNKQDLNQFDLAVHIRCGYEMKGFQSCRNSYIYSMHDYLKHIEVTMR